MSRQVFLCEIEKGKGKIVLLHGYVRMVKERKDSLTISGAIEP